MVEPTVAHVDIHKLGSRLPSVSTHRKNIIPCNGHKLGVSHHTSSFAFDKFRKLSQLYALENYNK